MNQIGISKIKEEEIKHIKTRTILEKINSKYIIKKIFDNLQKRISLDIIKYNKKIKTGLNIHLKDYKKYSEIEIEIMPKRHGKFINIINKKEKSFFHVYFDESKEEAKRNYLNKGELVKKIRVIMDYQLKLFYKLFYDCKCIKAMNFRTFNRSNINNMSYMFYECKSLKELNISNVNTQTVNSMSYMFYECKSLINLNLSNFITNKVTNMNNMFSYCTSLKKLNVSNFNTKNVTNMSYMFFWCSSLKQLNLSSFNTENIINMRNLFYYCKSLEELNIANFNINKLKIMQEIFLGCLSLKKIKCPKEMLNKELKNNKLFFKNINLGS
jgi:surface protein